MLVRQMQTTMLYMKDNYLKTFSAKVIAVGEGFVVLDQTAFYPLGGGQESDSGTLTYNENVLTVKSVRRDQGQVKHFLAETESLPKVGDMVECSIDWEKRLIHMRYHSAIHVLSKYMHLEYNADVLGNNISTRSGRADFDLEKALTEEQLKDIEVGVNKIITQNLPVAINFMPREEAITFLNEHGYQTDYIDMIPSSVKIFRIISVGEYDFASCAGTHVANTSEIGTVRITKRRSIGKGKERITLALD